MNVFFVFLIFLLFLFLFVSALSKFRGGSKNYLTDKWFYFIFFLFIVLNKLPFVTLNESLNSDEAINLSAGLSLLFDDPVLWRSVDFSTLGPFHTISFIIPSFFGFDIDYSNSRIVWLIYLLLSYYFIFKAGRKLWGGKVSQICFLYPGLFFAFGNLQSLSHFYNEASSIFILSIAIYILVLKYTEGTKKYLDFIFFFLIGISPFFKLQSVPIAALLAGFYYFCDIKRFSFSFQRVLIFAFFSILPTFLLLVYLLFFGQLNNFYNFYLFTNLNYGSSGSILGKVYDTFFVRSLNEFLISYFLKTIFVCSTILLSLVVFRFKSNPIYFFVLGLCWISIYAIAKPGYSYSHYFSYLILAFPMLLGFVFSELLKLKSSIPLLRNFVFTIYLFFTLALTFYSLKDLYFVGTFNNVVNQVSNFKSNKVPKTVLGEELLNLKSKFSASPKMVSFDWYPEIHVETNIRQATHVNVPERLFGYQVADTSVVNFSRRVFLEDLIKNRPEIVLIPLNSNKSYFDFTYKSFDRIPKIKEFIDVNYVKYKSVENVEILLNKDWK